MNSYICIAVTVVLAGIISLGCPAGEAASSQDTGVHRAETSPGGDGRYTVPSGHDLDPRDLPAVTVSEPLVSLREAVWFSDEVVFSAKVSPIGINGTVAVLLGGEETCIANLNDIGWPPDEVAQDGIWTGRLDWVRVPAPGRDLALSFAYRRDGRTIVGVPGGTVDLTEEAVDFTSFTCSPAGEVQLTDDLDLEAITSRGDLPGGVRVVFDTGQEYSLDDGVDHRIYSNPGAIPHPDQVDGDGIYNGRLAVPNDLPFNTPVKLRAQYLDTAGEVVASSAEVSITVLPPEVFLTDFICEPTGPVEAGELIRLKAVLNKTDQQQSVRVFVDGPGLERPAEVASFDGTEYQRGGRRLTGVWEGEFKWPWQMTEIGGEYRVYAQIASGSHIISELEAPPLVLQAPQVEILDVVPSEWPEVDWLQHIQFKARTNKPIRAGGLVIKVNGLKFGHLVDDGVSYGDGRIGYDDVTARDANWIGNFRWYSNQEYLEPGEAQPACVEYVFNDVTYATYELEPLTIGEAVAIESVYFEPAGPVRHGEDVEVIVDMAKKCSEGSIGVSLEDGTTLCHFGQSLKSSRHTAKVNWQDIPGPGDYGPVVVSIYFRAKPVATFTGERFVVIESGEDETPAEDAWQGWGGEK